MIRMRKEAPEVGWGEFTVLQTRTPEVLAIRYDWLGRSAILLHNFGAEPVEATIRFAKEDVGRLVINLLTEEPGLKEVSGSHTVMLEPYGYRWYRLGKAVAPVTRRVAGRTSKSGGSLPEEAPEESADKVDKVARRRRGGGGRRRG